MPLYDFECKKCEAKYETLVAYDASNKYSTVRCPKCNSKRKTRLMSVCCVAFTDPTTSSKFENFGYRAGYNMERAKSERRQAESLSHMGANPYRTIDDTPLDTGIHDQEAAIRL